MITIEIPLPTPSLNKLQRMHFHARKRLRDSYERIFRARTTSLTRALPSQFRRVKIVRYGPRQLDHDNLVGGCKPVLDALKRAGLIWDDSPAFLAVDYRQLKAAPKQARTVVSIV